MAIWCNKLERWPRRLLVNITYSKQGQEISENRYRLIAKVVAGVIFSEGDSTESALGFALFMTDVPGFAEKNGIFSDIHRQIANALD